MFAVLNLSIDVDFLRFLTVVEACYGVIGVFGGGMLFDSGTKDVLAVGCFGTVWSAFGFFGLVLL